MDEAEALDALASLLTELSQRPYDISLHVKHLRIASECGESNSALEMFTNFLAAGDEIWLPLIESKEGAEDIASPEVVREVLELYSRAEEDYICE